LDISTSSNLKDLILACFAGEQEDIKMAAAFALGHLAVGNMTLYLPTILQSVDTSSHHPHQYFLLVALKHLITIFATMNIQFVDYIESVLPGLILHCKSEEESVRSMVSECIGALLTMHSEKVMDPLLHTLDDVDDKFSRRTVATSIRFYLSRHAQCSDSSFVTNVLTSERMDHLLTLLSDTDLDVRRAALLMVNAAIRYLPAIVQFKLRDTVVPTLLDIMHFKQVREVDLGPFKHKVDDGVPLRKASLVGIESIMDAMPNYLDFNLFMTRLIPCISDNDEIKTQSLQVLRKVCILAPSSLLGSLDMLIEPISNIIKKKPKEGQAGPEVERLIDLIRSAVKAIGSISKVEETSLNRRWQDFVESVAATVNEFESDGDF